MSPCAGAVLVCAVVVLVCVPPPTGGGHQHSALPAEARPTRRRGEFRKLAFMAGGSLAPIGMAFGAAAHPVKQAEQARSRRVEKCDTEQKTHRLHLI